MELICHRNLVSQNEFSFRIFIFNLNIKQFADLEVSWILDSKKQRKPRMFFLSDEGKNIRNSTMRLNRGKTECRDERVYLEVSRHFWFV